MDRIVETFASRAQDAHFSYLASYDEILENNYNLSVPAYVEAADTKERIDIKDLNAKIDETVFREESLRKEIAAIINEIEVAE